MTEPAASIRDHAPSGAESGLTRAFAALAALTVAELLVAGAGIGRASRITALGGLLVAKMTLVLTVFMRARPRCRAPRLALIAVVAAVGYAVVLMIEAAYQARRQ